MHVLASYARRDGRTAEMGDLDPVDPQMGSAEEVEARDDRHQLRAALAHIPEPERGWLVAHEANSLPVMDLASSGTSATTMRARLARARSKLRVEYAVLSAGVELPTLRCRPALLATAGTDRARQSSAQRHVATCAGCTLVLPALHRRQLPAVLLLPLLWARPALKAGRAHPGVTAGAGTAAVASAAVAVAALSGAFSTPNSPGPAHAVTTQTPHPAPSLPVHTSLTTQAPVPSISTPSSPGRAHAVTTQAPHPAPSVAVRTSTPAQAPVPSTHARPVSVTPPARSPLYIDHRSWSVPPGSLESLVGQVVRADNALVVAVVAHNGFWVASSSPAARVYVQLVGPLRPLHVHMDERVSFVGTVALNGPASPSALVSANRVGRRSWSPRARTLPCQPRR